MALRVGDERMQVRRGMIHHSLVLRYLSAKSKHVSKKVEDLLKEMGMQALFVICRHDIRAVGIICGLAGACSANVTYFPIHFAVTAYKCHF